VLARSPPDYLRLGQAWCLIIEERLIVPPGTIGTLEGSFLSPSRFRAIPKEHKGTEKDPILAIQYQMAVSNAGPGDSDRKRVEWITALEFGDVVVGEEDQSNQADTRRPGAESARPC
jgi:hypothetical protein